MQAVVLAALSHAATAPAATRLLRSLYAALGPADVAHGTWHALAAPACTALLAQLAAAFSDRRSTRAWEPAADCVCVMLSRVGPDAVCDAVCQAVLPCAEALYARLCARPASSTYVVVVFLFFFGSVEETTLIDIQAHISIHVYIQNSLCMFTQFMCQTRTSTDTWASGACVCPGQRAAQSHRAAHTRPAGPAAGRDDLAFVFGTLV